jgi:hypothetical protein
LSEVWLLNFLQSYRTHFIVDFFKLSLSYHILSFSQLIFWSQDRLATMHRPSSSCWDSGLGSDVPDAAAESRWFPFNNWNMELCTYFIRIHIHTHNICTYFII